MESKHPSLAAAARFHGHLGPWLALGLKAGLRARRELGASPFELTAHVFCPARTPYSCFIDGVQVGSGCTLGKGNISYVRASGCRVEFRRGGGRSSPVRARRVEPAGLVYRLRSEVWDELHDGKEDGWEAGARLGRQIYRRPFEALFGIHRR
ncbi:MAG TPA: formylmethanofuran dehydrogenase subunit E family protein [bacterium]|nr:formylmethanofuran dehydrogenase subunit E family protein [bacterium]